MSIKKITFGTPESIVPSKFCKGFSYKEGNISFNVSSICHQKLGGGYLLEFPISADEQIYGLGLQLKSFNLKSKKMTLRVNSDPIAPTGDSHSPVPFFVTTANRGFYFDTARAAEFYLGYSKLGQKAMDSAMGGGTDELYKAVTEENETTVGIKIPAADGVDLYIIEGKNIADVVSQYNMMSGGGCDVPDWGLGTLFRCYYKYNENDILNIAAHLKENDLPCSVLGFEPGWQSKAYSCSFVKSEELYPNFDETVKKLRKMGYHINLWEHCFTHNTSPIYNDLLDVSGNYLVWNGLVPDFTTEKARKVFADYHRKYLVDIGVDGFKLDECDSSDFNPRNWSFPNIAQFPGGADGEQMHALLGTLYCQTMMEAMDYKPTLGEVRSLGALAAPYPYVLYSDLYDHNDFIQGLVNSGFSGLLWAPELRSVNSGRELLRRLQVLVFSPQCVINAWFCEERYPWTPYGCEKEVRKLLHLREKLIPRLKKAFDVYHKTGYPPIRALVMDFTDDTETYNVNDQYMFCDNILVAPISAESESDERKVYLPKGKWVDFFTRKETGSGWIDVKTKGIPVFEKID